MIASPHNVATIGTALDHPECVCIGPDGTIYAGGEAGQLYRIAPDGTQQQVACTGGFLLGIALDGHDTIHACDLGKQQVVRIDPDGNLRVRASGIEVPNYPVFDAAGNLYVSDSGAYFDPTGTGRVLVIRPDDTTEIFHAGPFRFANGLAIDPSGRWLYLVQSTAWNVVRIPLDRKDGPVESVFQLREHCVIDGITFASDGRLVMSCYRPDEVYIGHPDGRIELLIEDLTRELLASPTNTALFGGKLYLANLCGRHLSVLKTDMLPGPIHRPRFDR